jgi:hypothetical protein
MSRFGELIGIGQPKTAAQPSPQVAKTVEVEHKQEVVKKSSPLFEKSKRFKSAEKE